MANKILESLIEANVCSGKDVIEIYPKVRDREDISVLRCNKSKVIFLSQTDHVDISFYKNKEDVSFWKEKDYDRSMIMVRRDDKRRAEQFKDIIKDKVWVDIGTGPGGILDLLKVYAKKVYAIEPQENMRKPLIEKGYEVFIDIDQCPYQDVEVVTLFHVFEHVTDPIEFLKKIFRKMKKNAYLIIEVPHAREFLLKLNSFKEFTFWSEHLILHTKNSLRRFLEQAKFNDIEINGFQRYSFLNNLKWLLSGKPSSCKKSWISNFFDSVYSYLLRALGKTDTLIVVAKK